jgi:hypothetical protein
MCEPSHSIIQYPTQHYDSGEPTKIESIFDQLQVPKGIVIGSFINYSALGFGHSEALGKLPSTTRYKLPRDTKYEAHWWDRTVCLDGYISLPEYIRDESLESATTYAHRSSIGDLKILRRFLETSLMKSRHSHMYSHYLFQLFSSKGRQELYQSLDRIFNFKSYSLESTLSTLLLDRTNKAKVIGMILKITRKRENMSDAWADDKVLWTPNQELVML